MSDTPGEQTEAVLSELELAQACRNDLARLLPYWLSQPDDEREWQIQQFLDRIEAQPELLQTFEAVLRQRITAHEILGQAEPDYDLLRTLWRAVSLIKQENSG